MTLGIVVASLLAFAAAEDMVTLDVMQNGVATTITVPLSALDGSSNSRLATDTDNFWLLYAASLVFLMQAGFCLLEAGSVSIRNHKNILLKNLLDASLGALTFYVIGYAFAFGEGNNMAGNKNFALGADYTRFTDSPAGYNGTEYALWFFQFAFAATAATIVSGAIAERCLFRAYLVYSIVLTGFIYPIVVHWGWSAEGWASSFKDTDRDGLLFDTGVVDFAGSGVVHMTGGIAALVASIVIGPRVGRFNDDGSVNPMHESNPVLQALGTFILWFGWYGFNSGSTLLVSGGFSDVAAKVAVTTTLSAAAGCVTSFSVEALLSKEKSLGAALNGVLGGLVSITAGCSVVEPEIAIVIGILGALVYQGSSRLLLRLKIDDVVNASPVHAFCGAWGVLAAGLFANEKNYRAAYFAYEEDPVCGWFMGCDGKLFAANLVFVLAIIAWVGGTCTILFLFLKHVVGFRVPSEVEADGLDTSEHGGRAYSEMLQLQTPKASKEEPGMANVGAPTVADGPAGV